MNKVKKRKCIICEREFLYNSLKGKNRGASVVTKRGRNALTCSMNCSKIYTRIVYKIYMNKIKRDRQNANKKTKEEKTKKQNSNKKR